jgi:nucleoside-diphosphate-sugar epimerase
MYLVTGGAGFIGSHIVDELVRRGQKVRVLDNFYAGNMENLKGTIKKIDLIKGDIRDKKAVKRAVKGVKFILHEAALRSVPISMDNPEEFNSVNIDGTFNLLMAAREQKVKRFVFASSSSVYGNTDKLPEKESFPPEPVSPYAATKLMGEIYCKIFWESYKLPTVALRYFNVFGPRQSLENKYAVVVPKFVTCLLKNEHPPIHGSGKQTRDFTYVGNVVNANLMSINAKPAAFGKTFNIANGFAYSVLDLVRLLNKIMGKNIKPVFTPLRPGDVMHTYADIGLAKKHIGFRTGVGFEDGLKRTIEYFKEKYNEA